MPRPALPPAVFVPDGDLLVPTELARGPWDPTAQHGGPVAGLVARAVEAQTTEAPMQVARLTIELLRPVPLEPLTVDTAVLRPGRRVQLLETRVVAAGVEVARATALRIRATPIRLPELPIDEPPPPPDALAVAAPPEKARVQDVAFHSHAVEIRAATGGFDRPGPTVAWFRLRQPLVAGEEPSPLVRAAAAADFGNGISWVLPFDRYLFINPDLTIHLIRAPEGEWICLDARTVPGGSGAGLAESVLHDRAGRIGRAVQSLLVDES